MRPDALAGRGSAEPRDLWTLPEKRERLDAYRFEALDALFGLSRECFQALVVNPRKAFEARNRETETPESKSSRTVPAVKSYFKQRNGMHLTPERPLPSHMVYVPTPDRKQDGLQRPMPTFTDRDRLKWQFPASRTQ
jgi:hypothetical protein